MIVSIAKEQYRTIERVAQRKYAVRYDATEEDGIVTANEATINVERETYANIVSAIIGVKYSKDAELAALNNYISNPTEYTDAYRLYNEWRAYAKKTAKEALGIEYTIEDAKADKVAEIAEYDASAEVNAFSYGGVSLWISKADRVGLQNSLAIEKAAGHTESQMWFGGVSYTLPIDASIGMLAAIELYALACYNVTARHKAEVAELTTIAEVDAYDITQGYPEKLAF